jgi:peptidase M28-like protein
LLDPRLYRAALAPVLFALILAAFSLEDRPRPLRTTLAPDAFQGRRAFQDLQKMAAEHPRRRPGDASDVGLARSVAQSIGGAGLPGGPRPFSVRLARVKGETIDGDRELVNVIASRAGAPGSQIVVVAHRDAAGTGSLAELSGTAALVELARVLASGNVKRTVTLVSTSGGSGGAAGARAVAKQVGGAPVDAVLVLGDMASARIHKPWVVSYSNSYGVAPMRLTRTVQDAVKGGAGSDAGGPRAVTQWARLALPLTISEQGELGRSGLPAVLLSASGERTPAASARVSQATMQRFGRAALRTVEALDSGPDIGGGPEPSIVTQRKVLPAWSVRLLVASLLLAPLLVAVDGFARLRRRREPIGRGLVWTLAGTLPLIVACGFAAALGATGLVEASPPAPVPPGAIPVAGVALASVLLVFALCWLVLRPLVARLSRASTSSPGTAGALLLVLVTVAVVVWLSNPYAAALMVPALHAWLLILAPGVRLRRGPALALIGVGLLPFLVLVVADARSLGLGPIDTSWMALLLVAGGHFGVGTWLVGSLIGGVALGVIAIALRPPAPAEAAGPPEVTVRGPLSYAGPGSLGGTESALRR